MTGRAIADKSYDFVADPTQPLLLKVEDLSMGAMLNGVSFEMRAGEILGVTGLLGSGRTELALTLFGMTPADTGRISMHGKPVKISSIQDAIRHGIGYVPEDRLSEGLFLEQSIGNNVVVRIIDQLRSGMGLTIPSQISGKVDEWVSSLRIKTSDSALPVKTLSGGNQQRVVLAKWLASKPQLMILNGPTVGVDIGSKDELHDMMKRLAGEGMGLLVISDDIPELLSVCNRILLLRHGQVVDEILPEETNEDQLAAKLIED
jgi:simple sugar transport system ATP-binding protein